MSVFIVPVVMAVMSVYAAGTAIKALKDGDYVTAVVAGIAAYVGLSAVMAPAAVGTQAATTGATEVAANQTLGTMGTVATEGASMTPATSGTALMSSSMSAPLVSTAPAMAAPTATGGFLGGIKDLASGALGNLSDFADTMGFNEVVGGFKKLGENIFQNVETGELVNKSGSILKTGTTLMGGAGNIIGPMINKSAQEDAIDANKESEEKALAEAAAKRKRVGYVPDNASRALPIRSGGVMSTTIR